MAPRGLTWWHIWREQVGLEMTKVTHAPRPSRQGLGSACLCCQKVWLHQDIWHCQRSPTTFLWACWRQSQYVGGVHKGMLHLIPGCQFSHMIAQLWGQSLHAKRLLGNWAWSVALGKYCPGIPGYIFIKGLLPDIKAAVKGLVTIYNMQPRLVMFKQCVVLLSTCNPFGLLHVCAGAWCHNLD